MGVRHLPCQPHPGRDGHPMSSGTSWVPFAVHPVSSVEPALGPAHVGAPGHAGELLPAAPGNLTASKKSAFIPPTSAAGHALPGVLVPPSLLYSYPLFKSQLTKPSVIAQRDTLSPSLFCHGSSYPPGVLGIVCPVPCLAPLRFELLEGRGLLFIFSSTQHSVFLCKAPGRICCMNK